MPRSLTTLFIFLVLAAWAGAQGHAPGLTAADQLNMLRADRSLLSNLLDDGLDLAKAGTTLERAEGSRRTARSLTNALRQSAEEQNAERMAELGGLLETFVRDGLAPTLQDARQTIPAESPDAAKLKELQKKALEDLDAAWTSLPTGGKAGTNEGVKEARAKLEALRDKLK